MSTLVNTSNDNEINQVPEETKEGMVVARGTPYNHGVDSVAWLGQGENQLVVRSTDDVVSPVEGSSADMDDSASNKTRHTLLVHISFEGRSHSLLACLIGEQGGHRPIGVVRLHG